jgi:hypothetical protein
VTPTRTPSGPVYLMICTALCSSSVISDR